MAKLFNSRHSSRSEWRALRERSLLKKLLAAASVEESAVLSEIDGALTRQDKTVSERLERLGAMEAAMQEARLAFAADVRAITERVMCARDMCLLEAAASRGHDGLHGLRLLGELNPPWMVWEELAAADGAREAFKRLAAALEQTRVARSHALAQTLASEVSARRGRHGGQRPPRMLAHADVGAVLTARDVAHLRAGGWLDVPPGAPFLLSPAAMREVERDLRAHVSVSGAESTSSCNQRARTAAVPLLGEGFALSAPTRRLLALLAALPAEIERHGWPRPLQLPPLVQLGLYTGSSGARYSRHLDRNAWEKHNRREITILLYVNTEWDAATQGGCLRLHPNAANAAHAAHAANAATSAPVGVAPVDLAPLAGRLVLFPSATQYHEVLPCTGCAERLALTLWVEFGDDAARSGET
jgi:hypothetical protein